MRIFIAGTFPSDVLRDVNDRVARVRTRLPPSSWVRPESQHLTLAFLGELNEAAVPAICAAVELRTASLPAFEAKLHGCGFFPNSRNARVAWLGVEPEAPLHALAAAVRGAVTEAGVTLETGEFKAHLTLCRLRDHWPPACVEIFQSTFGKLESATFPFDAVTVFSSRLDPTGAIHTPLCALKLA